MDASSYLFDPSLVRSSSELGSELVLRPLNRNDFKKGYTNLLEQLTTVGDVDEPLFQSRFDEMKAAASVYWIVVIEDSTQNKLLATGTLVIEKKFTHNAGRVGHIEDVVVDSSARGKHLGKELVTQLRELGKSQGCYKIILDCSPEKSQFYLSCGFSPKERQMAWYIDSPVPGSSVPDSSVEQKSE